MEKRRAALEKEMLQAAGELDFENAVKLRDEMRRIEAWLLEVES